jgi:hypothetical protein
MLVIFSTDGFYLLDKTISDIFFQELDVEILVLLIVIKKKLLFYLYFLINPQKGWDLLGKDMHQIFVGKIL